MAELTSQLLLFPSTIKFYVLQSNFGSRQMFQSLPHMTQFPWLLSTNQIILIKSGINFYRYVNIILSLRLFYLTSGLMYKISNIPLKSPFILFSFFMFCWSEMCLVGAQSRHFPYSLLTVFDFY